MDRRKLETTRTKYHAEKCPVCNGFGTLKYGEKVCQGCVGRGYVIVPDFIDRRKLKNEPSERLD